MRSRSPHFKFVYRWLENNQRIASSIMRSAIYHLLPHRAQISLVTKSGHNFLSKRKFLTMPKWSVECSTISLAGRTCLMSAARFFFFVVVQFRPAFNRSLAICPSSRAVASCPRWLALAKLRCSSANNISRIAESVE